MKALVRRFSQLCGFRLEQFVLGGPVYRLLLAALLVFTIAVSGGTLAFYLDGSFSSRWHAIWWAFLRLTDSGYLGDDKGVLLTLVSTLVTLAGYVVFLGALVAIMTQWFQETIGRLELGLTPISQKDHIVVLGWSNRTPMIIRELFNSEGRVKRFLQKHGSRSLKIAVLAKLKPALALQELEEQLAQGWSPRSLVLRTGDHTRLEHLLRVDFLNASVLILPAPQLEEHKGHGDGATIKTLLTIADYAQSQGRELPLVVAEILEPGHRDLARSVYKGPLEIISSDRFLSRLVAQNLRHKGLSFVYNELLGHDWGNEIYLRDSIAYQGYSFSECVPYFPEAVPIGLIGANGNAKTLRLAPAPETIIEEGDKIIIISRELGADRTKDMALFSRKSLERRRHEGRLRKGKRRILLLGWSQRVLTILDEFAKVTYENHEFTIVSRRSRDDRQALIGPVVCSVDKMAITHIEGDFTVATTLSSLDLASFDAVLIMTDALKENAASADVRSILGYLVLLNLLNELKASPHILIELLDPENYSLLKNRPCEILLGPLLVSHMLSHVSLRRDLNLVFEEIFGPDGAEFKFVEASSLLIDGNIESCSFSAIEEACEKQGMIAVGYQLYSSVLKSTQTYLNPQKSISLGLSKTDQIVTLSRE